MNNILRTTSLVATVAAAALAATPAFAAASTATGNPQAKGKVAIMRALTLVGKEDLDLGTVGVQVRRVFLAVFLAADLVFDLALLAMLPS